MKSKLARYRRRRPKYILYKVLVPKIRYLRYAYEPLFPETWTIQDNANNPTGRIVFPINVLYNYGTAPTQATPSGYTIQKLVNGSTNTSTILGENIGIEMLDTQDPTARSFNSRINTALGPIYEDTVAGVIKDEYSWGPGPGLFELVHHYKLWFVENLYVTLSITQKPSTVDYAVGGVNTYDPGWADTGPGQTDQTLPGFCVFSRTLNEGEQSISGTGDVLGPTGTSINIRQSDQFRSAIFQEKSLENGFRKFTIKRKFNTLASEPNVEIDQLIGTSAASKTATHLVPPTLTNPATLTYGEIGFMIMKSQRITGSDYLRFEVRPKITRDVILFDRDELTFPSIYGGYDSDRTRQGADVGTTSHTRVGGA